MDTPVVMIVGAGATLSDAASSPIGKRPPLDKGFFKCARAAQDSQLEQVRTYVQNSYNIDLLEPEYDSLESILGIVYSDLFYPGLTNRAGNTFRRLLRMVNRRLAATTNPLEPTPKRNIYRIMARLFREGIRPSDVTIITYNQDLQIEKCLALLQSTATWKNIGTVFSFPHCYHLPTPHITSPGGRHELFEFGDSNRPGIPILKLHGSLNWYSCHTSARPSVQALLRPTRKLRITLRTKVSSELSYVGGHRKMYGFPIVLPPVVHKAGILHESLKPVWRDAEMALRNARRVIVFGYSCPGPDVESANLISRTIRGRTDLSSFSVVDPSPVTFQRYVDLTGLDRLSFFRSARAYLREG